MRASLKTRVARLEGQDEGVRHLAHIVYLSPDGLPEHPEAFEAEGPIICLPRKSPSAEQWVKECELRGQRLPATGDPL
jgi:hypothetical protein